MLAAGLISGCTLSADEAREVPDDEEEELTVALLTGNFFLGFSDLSARAFSRLSTESCNCLASLLHSSLLALILSRRSFAEGLVIAFGVDFWGVDFW